MTSEGSLVDQLQQHLKDIWGYDSFRPPQAEVIQCLLNGRDSLVMLPTGAGKSLCFQLPALLQTGVTLVISPLLALMENQVAELRQKQLPAATLHSELPPLERRRVLQGLERQQWRLLYLAPESLLSSEIWERLCQPELAINGIILDEAHCLAQWGESFRPAYRRLGTVRPGLLATRPAGTRIPIAAFTATANPATQEVICKVLGLEQPRMFRHSPYRRNLYLQVKTSWSLAQRRQEVLNLIQAHSASSGLVYTCSRRDTQTLADWFVAQGYTSAAYHAGLTAGERRRIETAWLQGELPFVISTSAFGMGVNKPDLRWVIHFHPPLTLTEYLQEIGRAGRDGQPAQALTLVSEPTGLLDPGDRQRRRFFQQQLQERVRQAEQLAVQIPAQGDLRELRRELPGLELALALWHCQGRLTWHSPFEYQLQSQPQPGKNLHVAAETLSDLALMEQFLQTRHCRWHYLLQAFGFTAELSPLRCNHCDKCVPKR